MLVSRWAAQAFLRVRWYRLPRPCVKGRETSSSRSSKSGGLVPIDGMGTWLGKTQGGSCGNTHRNLMGFERDISISCLYLCIWPLVLKARGDTDWCTERFAEVLTELRGELEAPGWRKTTEPKEWNRTFSAISLVEGILHKANETSSKGSRPRWGWLYYPWKNPLAIGNVGSVELDIDKPEVFLVRKGHAW